MITGCGPWPAVHNSLFTKYFMVAMGSLVDCFLIWGLVSTPSISSALCTFFCFGFIFLLFQYLILLITQLSQKLCEKAICKVVG